MNPLASYLRHLIVTGLVLAIDKLKLPVDGADAAADYVAIGIIGTVTWAIAKYGPALAKKIGIVPCLMALLACAACLSSVSCAGYPVAIATPWGNITSAKDGSVVVQPNSEYVIDRFSGK